MVEISGRCEPGFGAVQDGFAENFQQRGRRRRLGGGDDGRRAGRGPVGRVPGRGRHRAVGGGHADQRVLDDEDDDVPVGARPVQPWPARRRRAGRPLLARVRRRRQGGGPRPSPPRPHRRAAGMGRPPRRRRPVRLGSGHRAARRPGPVVGAGLEVRLPRDHPGQPGRRGRAADRRSDGRPVLRRRDRRAARRGLPHRSRPRARRPGGARHPAGRPRRRCSSRRPGASRSSSRRTRSRTAPRTRDWWRSSRGSCRGGGPRSPPPADTATPAAWPWPSRSCRPAGRRGASTCSRRRSIDRIFDVQSAGRDLVLGDRRHVRGRVRPELAAEPDQPERAGLLLGWMGRLAGRQRRRRRG